MLYFNDEMLNMVSRSRSLVEVAAHHGNETLTGSKRPDVSGMGLSTCRGQRAQ